MDGAFLAALKAEDCVFLDELNIASQSVVEELNNCEAFIPELCFTFKCSNNFRVFASQNPPLNTGMQEKNGIQSHSTSDFRRCMLSPFRNENMLHVTTKPFPSINPEMLYSMIMFNNNISEEASDPKTLFSKKMIAM